MAQMKELRIVDLPLDEIEVGDRVRMVSPAAVNIIAMGVSVFRYPLSANDVSRP